jgi:hypothetical protein
VSRGADLPIRDGGGGICPGYEFIDIPYNGWGCEFPFVADVLDIDIMLLVSYDGKLGATDFSNVPVNFLIDSSNPSVGTMLRRRRSCRKKHLRQICLYVVPKLPLMKLRYYNVSEDEGSNRLRDGMTF